MDFQNVAQPKLIPKQCNRRPTEVSLSFMNVCSLVRKVNEIKDLVAKRGIHVMALAETWLNDNVSPGELVIPHFNLHRRDRTSSHRGGGVAIYTHESLPAARRCDLEHQDIELLWIEIRLRKKSQLVGCYYRPPGQRVEQWEHLQASIERAQAVSDDIILVGDFNVDMLDATDHHRHHLCSVMDQFDLTNQVTSATRVTGSSATMIDLFLTTKPIVGDCEVLKVDVSDHYALLGRASHAVFKEQVLYRSRNFDKVDWEAMNCALRAKLQAYTLSSDLDESVERWQNIVLTELNKLAPLKTRNRKSGLPCPWLNSELKDLVRRRNQLHKQLCRNPQDDTLRNEHKEARRAARKLDRRLRNQYFRGMCDSGEPKAMWKAINTVSGRARIYETPNVSADSLSTSFGEVVSDPLRPLVLQVPEGPCEECSLTCFKLVSIADTTKLLLAIDQSKATGSDQIPGVLLKNCARALAPSLTLIFNRSLSSGVVPKLYKVSHVCPLFKSGDRMKPGNYRPVSLLPIVSRLLEKCVQIQLVAYLENHSLLPLSQFAYRKHHSTEDALILALNRWQHDKHNRNTTGIALIDMSKAFDRVRHQLLIQNLSSIGIHDIAIKWIVSYLSDRVQQVKISSEVSSPVQCTRGVPQGSVLGPLLFTLYTRQLSECLPDGTRHQEFADDILLDFSSKNPDMVAKLLSTAVTNVAAWLDSLGLVLNASKTQVMFISPRGAAPPEGKVYCNNKVLNTVNSARYLGLQIDNDLHWSSHLSILSRKISQLAGALWRNGKALTLTARRSWLVAIARTKLTYASNAFYPSLTAGELLKLNRQFKYCVRTVFRVHPPVSSLPLLNVLKLLPLETTLRHKIAVFVFRCLHGTTSNSFHGFFNSVSQSAVSDSRRETRGTCSNLLLVPFLPGPAGRSTIQFFGSVLWNELSVRSRSIHVRDEFVASL